MKKVIDYSITPVYFYRFVCNEPNIINTYVGSSIDLTKRKNKHKSDCNNPNDRAYNLLVYKTIRENGGWDNWRMLEIEHKIVKDKTEAKQQEQYWIEYFNAQMNMIKATFNKQEYQREYDEQHLEQLTEYRHDYRNRHRDEINAKQRKNREQRRDEYNAYKRDYYEQHREEKKEYNREYQREYRKLKKEQNLMSLEDIRIL